MSEWIERIAVFAVIGVVLLGFSLFQETSQHHETARKLKEVSSLMHHEQSISTKRMGCNRVADEIIDKWVDAYNLVLDSYNEGYYFSWEEEQQLNQGLAALNQATIDWRIDCQSSSSA